MSSEYRVGVIGCGGISRAHANGHRAAGLPIVAAADISQEQVKKFAAEYELPLRPTPGASLGLRMLKSYIRITGRCWSKRI